MSKLQKVSNVGLSVLIFFVAAYGIADFLMVDNCLDHGGKINEVTGDCETNGEPISLLKKTGSMFWLSLLETFAKHLNPRATGENLKFKFVLLQFCEFLRINRVI